MSDPAEQSLDDDLPNTNDSLYGEYYYRHDCGLPYERNEHWVRFFGMVADAIVRELRPRTVLDVGCAMGFLVEELRVRGVEAWGIDVSDYAVANVHESVAPYCAVSSAAANALPDGFPADFDLVTCVEVIEHLKDEDVLPALSNLTKWGERVLFSSSPEDYSEATHLNVKSPDAWSARFAGLGMWRNLDIDASFLTPWAAVYDHAQLAPPELVARYERAFVLQRREIRALRDEAVRRHAAEAYGDDGREAAAAARDELLAAQHEIARLAEALQANGESAHEQVTAFQISLAAAAEEITTLKGALEQSVANEQDALLGLLAARDHAVGSEAAAGQLRAQVRRLGSDITFRDSEIARLERANKGLHEQIDGTAAIIRHRDQMLASETWRIGRAITSPVRALRRLNPRARRP